MLLFHNVRPDEEHETHPREREYQATYRAYFFGQFRLYYNNKLIKEPMWRRNKAKSLLKWFLLNPGKLYSADQFIDLLWPDLPLETALCNLHVTIHCLRRLLEPSLTPRQESRFIRRQTNNFYWFHMDETWWTDTTDVQHLFEAARTFDVQEDYTKAAFYYRKIASYCNLGFLPEDDTEEWQVPYRHRYEYMYTQALTRLIQIYQGRNELEEMQEYAYQALSLDPHCEPAMKAIIDAYLKQGNVSMAMHKLNAFRSNLHNELGLEPSQELLTLRKKIMLG
jgi:DNA-binding SARP family transcriptional activator